MTDGTLITVNFRPLKLPESFFEYGRPLVDPRRPRAYLSRPLDLLIIIGLVVSFIALFVHAFVVLFTLPEMPVASNIVSSQCAVMTGEWNEDQTIVRFWSVPYAVPPVVASEVKFPMVMEDINEKRGLRGGGFRWHQSFTDPDVEYCFLTFDERCEFQTGKWSCQMKRPNRTSLCLELDKKGEIVSNSSENCLTLDIAMPRFRGELLPVIVLITGSRFIHNPINPQAVQEPAYLPTDKVVSQFEAIWVNVRYRLGPFGSFYNLNQMGSKDVNATEYMNFALHDQRAALRWVKVNIGRFGGDPERIALLAHGSGATGALALINWQSQQGGEEGLFNSVWIASGALNWYDRSQSKWQRFRPYELVRKLYQCDYKTDQDELPDRKRLNNSDPCYAKARIELLTADVPKLIDRFNEYYMNDLYFEDIITPSLLTEKRVSMWFGVDNGFDTGLPIEWSAKVLDKIFTIPQSKSKPRLDRLVFSSMESEFEEARSSERNQAGAFRQLLIRLTESAELYDRLIRHENSRVSSSDWPPRRNEWQISLNALAALRYTCPQAWLLSKWLSNRTIPEQYTKFYHVYQAESPRYPFVNVPTPPAGIRKNAFHGMDILLLTGHFEPQPSAFTTYKNALWDLFKKFVHGLKMDERCQINPRGDAKEPIAQSGCILNSGGINRVSPQGILDALCKKVNWTANFHDLAMFE
ncbi:unnamed protein product [Calicophoron daubneyi]|uniref:Carboxylesterase type B domain-containing protein n=1 Tax=Calicophoron daubneyi TaxID=300641 RepID=A0AAV2T557_CALDB